MKLIHSWPALAARLQAIAEGSPTGHVSDALDAELATLGLVTNAGELTAAGHDYYVASAVIKDADAAATALRAVLEANPVVRAFCEPLWAVGEVPVEGALSLLRRVTGSPDDASAKRWLALMNSAKIIAYNRNRPRLRVFFNPSELGSPDESAAREKASAHVISPATPYGNLLALRSMIRAARGHICWYEQHMPPKVMEVLYREVEKGQVTEVKLLSGPANIDQRARDDYKRFREEMHKQRAIRVEWRILEAKEAQKHHDRHFFSEGIARNLPPLNSILGGSTGEILESGIGEDVFNEWWRHGVDLRDASAKIANGPGR